MPNKTTIFRNNFFRLLLHITLVFLFLFSGLPASLVARVAIAEELNSTNFTIRGDEVTGGSSLGESSNFISNGSLNYWENLGESSNFEQQAGYNPRIEGFVPEAPTLNVVAGNAYDRLRVTIDPTGNPSNALFAIAFSPDNFSTWKFVQSDGTIGDVLSTEDYLSYAGWGGLSGTVVTGLEPNTTYTARVAAWTGDVSSTRFGPASNAESTTEPTITLDVSANALEFGVLSINSVGSTSSVDLTVNTSVLNGYQVLMNGTGDGSSAGLAKGSELIPSSTGLLAAGTSGYGAQVSSGDTTVAATYDVTGNNVGAVNLAQTLIASNTGNATNEITSVLFKAAISSFVEAGVYSDTVYFTVSPSL